MNVRPARRSGLPAVRRSRRDRAGPGDLVVLIHVPLPGEGHPGPERLRELVLQLQTRPRGALPGSRHIFSGLDPQPRREIAEAADHLRPHLSRNLALRDALRPIAARNGVSTAAVAVAWTLSWPGVSGAIVGARSPSQVDGWLAAGNLTLDKEDLSEIAGAVERTSAGAGPARPYVGASTRRRSAER